MKNLLMLLLVLLSASVASAGMIDDFEGGVDWSAPPWSAQYPTWNKTGSESAANQMMNAEWAPYQNDFNGGPDFGYIEHDTTKGALGTSSSLKYVVRGGNKNASQPPSTYGQSVRGGFHITGQPVAGQTITINGNVFTWQTAARSAAWQIQIGASVAITAANLASAINTDIISPAYIHASVSDITTAYSAVLITCIGQYADFRNDYTVTETSTNILFSSVSTAFPSRTVKDIYTNYVDMQTTESGAGNFYLYFGSAGGSFSTGLHDRFVVPAAKRPDGSNRMSMYILSPSFGNKASTQNINIGTRVNSESRFAAGCHAGEHYYHQFAIPQSQYWQKIIITNNPDHQVSLGGNAYTPNNITQVLGGLNCSGTDYPFDYMEGMSHFYIEGTGQHTTPVPFEVNIDEVEIYQETRTEADEFVASRVAAYLGGNTMWLGWTGRWGSVADGAPAEYSSTSDSYTVYYSTTPLTSENFSSVGTQVSGTFTRAEYTKFSRAEFTIPNFSTSTTYYFAISPTAAPTTAGFIDYTAGSPSSPPSNGRRYRYLSISGD